jgi:hypothetical protein
MFEHGRNYSLSSGRLPQAGPTMPPPDGRFRRADSELPWPFTGVVSLASSLYNTAP